MLRILIIEDDQQISKSLSINLKYSGYEIDMASTLQQSWELLKENHYDGICLDVGLPDGSGIEFCQKVRDAGHQTPILFISAMCDEATVVRGLKAGGDDYLRKPFGVEELKIRMNRILKKFTLPENLLTFGGMTIEPNSRIVKVMDQIVSVGKKELEILVILTKEAGKIVSREMILETLYGHSDMYDRTIDSHMSHLRKKIKESAGGMLQIKSVYGLGYRLEWEA